VEWQAHEVLATGAAVTQGTWLIVGNAEGVGEVVARRVRAAGGVALVIPQDQAGVKSGPLSAALEGGPQPLRVVLVPPFDADGMNVAEAHQLMSATRAACEAVLQVAQALLGRGAVERLVIVTRNAQAVAPGASVDVAHAAVWGLASRASRTAQQARRCRARRPDGRRAPVARHR
jgi:hypothetical protein